MKTKHLQIKGAVIISVLLFFSPLLRKDSWIVAQQVPFSSQYYSDPLVLNPAYTGNNQRTSAYLTHRSQWTSIKGAPQTSFLTIDGPVEDKNIGLGMKFYTYSTDIISQTGAALTYSYRIKISEDQKVVFGLAMGILDNKIDYAKAIMRDKDDPYLLQQQQSKAVFNTDFGLLYSIKKLEIGFSVPQILANKMNYSSINGDPRLFDLARHYQGSIKYVVDVVKDKGITLFPLVYVRSVSGAPLQYDFNTVLDWKKIGWIGFTYHSSYALAVSGGVRFKNLCLGYAYDIGISNIKTYTGSSTEFLLGYVFTKKNTVTADTSKGELWAEQIQSSTAFIQPVDYDDEYWNSLNKNVDKQKIFNNVVDAVISGKVQAYDILTNVPMSVEKVKSSLVRLGDTPKLITKNDISKVRMNEKWIFDKQKFSLAKKVTRIDLLIKVIDEAGEETGNDKPLFYVKMKN